MMRQALATKNVNGDNKYKSEELGKLKRQIGRTNLHNENTIKSRNSSRAEPTIRTNSGEFKGFDEPSIRSNNEEFEVYEDPSPSKTNNVIHDLEKKLEQKTKEEKEKENAERDRKLAQHRAAAFLRPRDFNNFDTMSTYDEASSAAPSVCGTVFEDDDFDRFSSVASGLTLVRSDFSHFNVGGIEEEEALRKKVNPPIELVERDAGRNITAASRFKSTLADREKKQDNILNCDDYYHDILAYMCDRQTKVRSSSRYMRKQPDLTVEMRAILIDWFSDVVTEYGLQQETFHLAVSLVDRVLSRFCVEKHRLQLVGSTAMMIASKYEEIYPPELKDFSHITDDTFKPDQILTMERYLMSQLEFVISAPTTAWFGACFARRAGVGRRTRHAMEYLIDLTLLDYGFLQYRPSHIAAACLCYSRILTDCEPWPLAIANDTFIRATAFSVILPHIHRLFAGAPSDELGSMYSKYSDSTFSEVALLHPPENMERFQFEAAYVFSGCETSL